MNIEYLFYDIYLQPVTLYLVPNIIQQILQYRHLSNSNLGHKL
uniref:Uncharacterized protein n=1 Tax=Cryptosporidium parvum TaxID=5807 RepID=F0X5Y0_CRYPV